ncbi:MAG: hypothetical protein IKP16_05395 [Prevotella sp.]|nr:hypothetical protein [Prevotella sp.]
MKHYKTFAWMMAIAIASMTMTACSSGDIETEKPFTTCPASETTLYACGINQSVTRSMTDVDNIIFTEDDIEWFNVTTREIKFKDTDEPLYKRLEPYREIKFYLGDNVLFVVSSFVSDIHSMIFTDLVLHYDLISDPNQGHYYLHDCYPSQFINDERTQANIRKNASQWELFTYYLESKGKLRK